jgi:hypothetical protein
LNYYYQGQVDNCVMGGLVNAIFWMIGPDESDALLMNFTPVVDQFWDLFVRHVSKVLGKKYVLKKMYTTDVLQMDDTCPVVVQLRAGDKSESHAVCIFNGHIYDSASRYVLDKTGYALNWCCGTYGFEAHR